MVVYGMLVDFPPHLACIVAFNRNSNLPFTRFCYSVWVALSYLNRRRGHIHTCKCTPRHTTRAHTPLLLPWTILMLDALWTHWLSGSHGKRQDSIALTITWTFLLKIHNHLADWQAWCQSKWKIAIWYAQPISFKRSINCIF